MAPTFFTAIKSTVSEHLARADKTLSARDSSDSSDRHQPTVDPSSGVLDPHDINNVGFFVLFALIGVGFVVTGIWFFFWAKNGGFHTTEHDWEDYKSTVLRRKGPNGTILSGATRTTRLGGGSVYKDVHDAAEEDNDNDDGRTVMTESTMLSGITAGASDIYAREKRKRKQEKRDRERARKGKNTSRRFVGEHGVLDEVAEEEAKQELRNYRHEKAARVGGINKEAEGSEWDGSTNAGTDSNVSSSLLSGRQKTPTTTPTATPTKKSGPGIRKVYSVADRRDERDTRDNQRMRSESRRVREAGRQARRDFSYQRTNASQSESLLEGYSSVTSSALTYQSGNSGSDLGTKSYHHPMPELRELERERNRTRATREEREREREERRARRGGYRRGRTEEEEVD